MAGETLSTSMGMPIPAIGITAGPQWATDVNNCLTIIDGHNHTAGYGVQVPSSGLDINSDLSFNSNNIVDLRSARFTPQSAILSLASDLTCLYVVNEDLYYNDGLGNNVRITQSGALAGTPGSIANLVAPASVTYVSGTQTYVFQSNVNVAANLDIASVVLRNSTASSYSMTLSPPNAMASDTVVTLPSIPAQTALMTISSGGNMSTTAINQLVPTGASIIFSGASVPSGYLAATGTAVSRTTYANLFSVIGTTYGSGDGSTTFNLPTAPTTYFSGANSIPSYVQSYWKMSEASGTEPNYATISGTYDLIETGTVMSAAGWVSPLTSRGTFNGSNYFSVPLLNSNTTPYDNQVFAFGCWFKSTTTGVGQILASKYSGSGTGYQININGSNFMNVLIGGSNHIATGLDVADAQWHYVFVCNLSNTGANNFRIYVDNNVLYTGAGLSWTPASTDLFIGNDGSGAYFTGYMQLIEWWTSTPTTWSQVETAINQRWNAGVGRDYIAQIAQTYVIKT